ncbi:hypothetical protein [Allorhizobium undicola]|uniref:hypothetical protein n=1 Tax=Allorhizobium undicola TaxID=78527 RepID=UPI0012B5695F|nr:hypothetical protein [Allorhizobium undicola]
MARMDFLGALLGEASWSAMAFFAVVLGTFIGSTHDPVWVAFIIAVIVIAFCASKLWPVLACVAMAASFRVVAPYFNYVKAGLDFWGSLPLRFFAQILIFGSCAIAMRVLGRCVLRRQ